MRLYFLRSSNALRTSAILCSGEKTTKLSCSVWACSELCDRCEAAAVSDPAVKQPLGLKISAGGMCVMAPDRLLLGIPWSLGHYMSAACLSFTFQLSVEREWIYAFWETALVPSTLRSRFCSSCEWVTTSETFSVSVSGEQIDLQDWIWR